MVNLLKLSLGVGMCAAMLFGPEDFSARAETNAPVADGRAPKTSAVRKVGVDEFEKLWREKKGVVLDVRTSREYAAGHIPGAINLDVNSSDFAQKVAALDTNQTYLVHCAAGVRSAKACDKMSHAGFNNLVDLTPGFRGWEKAGKPVEKSP